MQNWKNTNLRQQGSPAINETRVVSSQGMSDLCANFVKPTCNPSFGLHTRLEGGIDRSEEEI